jgi:poly-gamma-glutamate capsule biosynthesis protein CapA/YwtB (metallophosphatase superfamily)
VGSADFQGVEVAVLVAEVQADPGKMNRTSLILLLSLLSLLDIAGQYPDTSRLRMIFAGDLMGHDGQITSAWDEQTKSYQYDTCFSMIRDLVSSADIALLNLEVTLAGEPYKGYPQFSSPDNVAIAAKNAGFDIFISANNHALDGGKKGIERTISVLNQNGIIRTGTFRDSLQRAIEYPLIVEKNNIRLAILNYTYGTNGLVVTSTNIVNYIDTAAIVKDIAKARLAEPDFIIATLHWGLEYQRMENKQQEELAEFLLKSGVDAIIGSHPHVIQPIRKYYNDPSDTGNFNLVVYSLGNFISNQGERFRDGGLMVEVEIQKTDKTKITDLKTHPVFVYKPPKYKGGEVFVLLPTNDWQEMISRFKMPEGDQMYFKTFREDTEEHLKE